MTAHHNAAGLPDDPLTELRSEQLGKKHGHSEVCPRFTPCQCGLLRPSPPCDDCVSTPAMRYLVGAQESIPALQGDMSATRRDHVPLVILGVLVLLCTLVVSYSVQKGGPRRPHDPPPTLEAS